MSMPKKRTVNITPPKTGQDRVDQLMDDVDLVTNNFLSGILIEDLEVGMRDFIRELNFTLDGEKVPVIFMPGERWSEFAKNWKHLDEDNNPVFPLISVRRLGPPEQGTSVMTKYTIPGRKTFTYMRVPTWDGNYRGVDVYKIPQPVPVDIKYEVRVFSHYIRDVNKFGELVLTDFSSRQSYSKVKGRFMPIIMDGAPSDESTIEDFSGDRYFAQAYNFIMQGYIQDPEEFEITPAVKKILVVSEVEDDFIVISGGSQATAAPSGGTTSFTNTYSTDFDGADDTVDIGLVTALNGASTFTISAWINLDSIGANRVFFGVATDNPHRLLISAHLDGSIVVGIANGADSYDVFSVGLSLSTWYHIVVVFDGGETGVDRMTLYIDGVAETTAYASFPATTATFTTSTFIGSYDAGTYPFNGKIDEVSIFDEVKAIGDLWDGSGKPTDLSGESGLVAWYRMGDGDTYPTILDNAGSNDGTMTNMEADDFKNDVP